MRYLCWESGGCDTYTMRDLKRIYKIDVDKKEYTDFEDWLSDMIKSGILIEEK